MRTSSVCVVAGADCPSECGFAMSLPFMDERDRVAAFGEHEIGGSAPAGVWPLCRRGWKQSGMHGCRLHTRSDAGRASRTLRYLPGLLLGRLHKRIDDLPHALHLLGGDGEARERRAAFRTETRTSGEPRGALRAAWQAGSGAAIVAVDSRLAKRASITLRLVASAARHFTLALVRAIAAIRQHVGVRPVNQVPLALLLRGRRHARLRAAAVSICAAGGERDARRDGSAAAVALFSVLQSLAGLIVTVIRRTLVLWT